MKGDSDSLTGLLEPENFEHNVKSIRKEYEAYVLSIGEYDERVFLGDDADENIGTPAKIGSTSTGEYFSFQNLHIAPDSFLRILFSYRIAYKIV